MKLGVAGLGFGAAVHAAAFAGIEGVRVVAIAGSTRERTRAVADRLGIEDACGGMDELLDRELDAVSLALPPCENERAVAEALKRGIPVLCEKPLASCGARAQELANMAKHNVAAINYRFPEIPAFKAMKEVLDRGRLGAPRFAQVTWLVNSYAHQHGKWSWKTDAARCGGVITLLGSHILHVAEWLFGPVETVLATTSNAATARFAPGGADPAEDTAHLTLRFADATTLCATVSNASPGRHVHRWEIICEMGSAVVENPTSDYVAGFNLRLNSDAHVEEAYPGLPSAQTANGRLDSFSDLARQFIDAIQTSTRCDPDLATGARVQQLMDAARKSTAEGAVASPVRA